MYLYGTLMAHRVMDEFMRADFEGHERFQPHMNAHLFESTASRSQLKSLTEEVVALRRENVALYDKVAGFARRLDSLSHPSRNNGGGGGGAACAAGGGGNGGNGNAAGNGGGGNGGGGNGRRGGGRGGRRNRGHGNNADGNGGNGGNTSD